jgi:2-iminobutanoate/2-iminopropanoate deaminase
MRAVTAADAPAPVGPYSQAVAQGGLLFVSGQIPLDPKTGTLVVGDIEAQTEQVISNLRAILEAADTSLARVVRTTIYLTDISLFGRINAVYARFFCGDPAPARATVQVAALPLDAEVEIDAIAALD